MYIHGVVENRVPPSPISNIIPMKWWQGIQGPLPKTGSIQ